MAATIKKLPKGAVVLNLGDGEPPLNLNRLTCVNITVYKNKTLILHYLGAKEQIDIPLTGLLINGEPNNRSPNDTAQYLIDEVFNFGGGNGLGVAESEYLIFTKQPEGDLVEPGTQVTLEIDFIGEGATVGWYGSEDWGVTYPHGPYTSNKAFSFSAEALGSYRAQVEYKGKTYYSNTAHIRIIGMGRPSNPDLNSI